MLITAFLLGIIIPIIMPLIYKDDIQKGKNKDRVIFEFNNATKVIILVCTIILVIMSAIFLSKAIFNGDKDKDSIGSLFFSMFSLFFSIAYLNLRNKKIIWQNNKLYVYNIFGKQKQKNIQEVTKAIEYPGKGMELLFKDNSKLRIDMQMINYSKIKEILDENEIIYEDKNGNITPKGW